MNVLGILACLYVGFMLGLLAAALLQMAQRNGDDEE